MDARKLSLEKIFASDERLEAPLFQRPYVWKMERNWEPLWESVQAIADRRLRGEPVYPHFLGTIVLEQVGTGTGLRHARQIIDGQQRLTTLQLLLASFRDHCNQLAESKFVKALEKLTINDDPVSEEPDQLFKIWPTTADQEDFRAVMTARTARAVRKLPHADPKDEWLIPNAYLYFADTIQSWLGTSGTEEFQKRLSALYTTVLKDLHLVVIDLTDGDDPQEIFETLNAHGTPLLPADLVKNYLFHLAKTQTLDTRKLFTQFWEVFDKEKGYWREEVAQGRLYRPRLDLFLFHYLTLLKADLIPAGQLFSTYRKLVESSVDKDARRHMEQFRQYADIYAHFETFPRTSRAGIFFERLGELDTSTLYPLLLEVLKRFGGPAEQITLDSILVTLESFLIRRLVCELTTKNYNKLFVDLIKRARAANDFSAASLQSILLAERGDASRWPDDSEFRKAWTTISFYRRIKRSRARMILEALEAALETGKTEKVLLDGDLQIEHLLPQDWEEHWPLYGAPQPDFIEQAKAARNESVHSVGNLTLLTKHLNPSIGNGPWKTKRNDILEHSRLNLNRSLLHEEHWHEASIAKRSEDLFIVALKAWPHPGVKDTSMPPETISRSELAEQEPKNIEATTEDSIEVDRTYWISRVPLALIEIADDCLDLINEVANPKQHLNYKRRYIGLSDGSQIRNFVYFTPKKKFIYLGAEVKESNTWKSRFESAGAEYYVGDRHSWILLRTGDLEKHKALIRTFLHAATEEYQKP